MNFSYSAYSTYLQSQLWFYFQRVVKAKPDNRPSMQVYGSAGNAVHKSVEDYISYKNDNFDKHWKDLSVDEQRGFNNVKLQKEVFRKMFRKICNFYDNNIKFDSSQAELKITKSFFGMGFVAVIDLYTELENDIIIYDWKTNSQYTKKLHELQRKVYSWFVWKCKGKVPLCRWVYAKDMSVVEERYSESDMLMVESDIQRFILDLKEKGMDISKFELGNYNSPFNDYFSLCVEEKRRREDAVGEFHVRLAIRGNFVFFDGDVPDRLLQGVDFKTRFDLPNKHWMQEAVKRKARGKVNLQNVGTVHLYNAKFKCFPIGLLDKITGIIHEYGEYYNRKVKIFLDDYRDVNVMNACFPMKDKLCTKKVFRPYQVEAVRAFMKKRYGILNCPTGSGKTLIAAEIIRQAGARVLWVCDRKELLSQTKGVLEDFLGVRVGQIGGGKMEVEQVTIATVQSLNSRLNELRDYLFSVNMVVVDEFHKSAAEGYQKVFCKLPNTKFRLGLTATCGRDDGKTPILYSVLGDICYKISTEELINDGFLMKPRIEFYELERDFFGSSYVEDYRRNIIENAVRNDMIARVCMENPGKKVLILTKMVDHGKMLCTCIPESMHLYGGLISGLRDCVMNGFREGRCNRLVMTLSMGAEGLDLPDLDIIINAAANKGDVKSIQVLGRVLRIFEGKEEVLYVDFVDGGKYTYVHSLSRIEAFKGQGHQVLVRK